MTLTEFQGADSNSCYSEKGGDAETRKEQPRNPEYPLEGLMLKLKLQYFGHLVQRANSLEKSLMLGKTESRRKRDNRG